MRRRMNNVTGDEISISLTPCDGEKWYGRLSITNWNRQIGDQCHYDMLQEASYKLWNKVINAAKKEKKRIKEIYDLSTAFKDWNSETEVSAVLSLVNQ
jgi:hypothetical protein